MANTSLKVSSKFTGISQTFLLLLCHRISAFPNIKRLFYAAVVRDISVAAGMRLNNHIVFYFNSRYIFAVVYHAVNIISEKLPVVKTIFPVLCLPAKSMEFFSLLKEYPFIRHSKPGCLKSFDEQSGIETPKSAPISFSIPSKSSRFSSHPLCHFCRSIFLSYSLSR